MRRAPIDAFKHFVGGIKSSPKIHARAVSGVHVQWASFTFTFAGGSPPTLPPTCSDGFIGGMMRGAQTAMQNLA